MAYDEKLAARVQRALAHRLDVTQRKMFGGLAFMVSGHMACGILNDRLMVRLGDASAAAALEDDLVQEMAFTGRPMASMVFVLPGGVATDARVTRWVSRAVRFTENLPPK